MNEQNSYFAFLISRIKDYIPLNSSDIELLGKLFIKEKFKKNGLILKEGEFCHKIFFIAKGIVRYSVLIDGEERSFSFRAEGDFCSAMESFLERVPSKYTISAMEMSVIYSITYEKIKILYQKIKFGDRFGRLTIEQLFVMVVNHLTTFYSQTPEQRYTQFVADHKNILQRIPQYHIASYIGISPQALCRIKKKILKAKS